MPDINPFLNIRKSQHLQSCVIDMLRKAEATAPDKLQFRQDICVPILTAIFDAQTLHRITLSNGLKFDVNACSPIEQAFMLSPDACPDHVWEPQTTKLAVALTKHVRNVVIGGAFIGDQALAVSSALSKNPSGELVYAFEPMQAPLLRLNQNISINGLTNIKTYSQPLWSQDNVPLEIEGGEALGVSHEIGVNTDGFTSKLSITLDTFTEHNHVFSPVLLMLDLEGAEIHVISGFQTFLQKSAAEAPIVIFEVHRNYVDWTNGLEVTPAISMLLKFGYTIYGIRDMQGNYPMGNSHVELVPLEKIYLTGPPHGFNLLALKDVSLLKALPVNIVNKSVSPKLLLHKDPALHAPEGGFPVAHSA